MSGPAGWQWIEARRNGTISDEDFDSLQKLLREEPDVRRPLRRYMAMDTALRDHAEAQVLIAGSEATDDPHLVRSAAASRSQFAWRELVAWLTAAGCLLAATVLWFTIPTTTQNSLMIVETVPRAESAVVESREPTVAELTIAEQRELLLNSAPDVLHLRLVNSDSGSVAREPRGDIVWSSGREIGYLRLQGLAIDEPVPHQYQLWIVGGDASNNEFINGGMFFVAQNTGELTVPIHADHFVQMPKMFLVSVEPVGGGNASTAALFAKADDLVP
jgi:hypothetical protein